MLHVAFGTMTADSMLNLYVRLHTRYSVTYNERQLWVDCRRLAESYIDSVC